MNRHPERDSLRRLLAGDLDPLEADRLLEHIEECAECLDRANRAWQEMPGLIEHLEIPAMEPSRRARVELHLLRKVHAAQLGNQVSWIVTEGLVSVVVLMLRPVLGGRLPLEGPTR